MKHIKLYEEFTSELNEKVNASGYIKAGKLGYNDQFLGRQSLSKTLSLDLGLSPKNEFSGPWIGFDHMSMYASGKNGGTILDDALAGKYTYDELKAAAAKFMGIKESVVTEASGDLKVGDSGIDYNDNVVEIVAIGRYKQIAKMFKKEMKADAEDYGFEELMVNTDYYLTKNIQSPEGNVGDFAIYPVRYDMANYWGLDPLDESVVNEAKAMPTAKAAKKFEKDVREPRDAADLASWVYTNYDVVTGLDLDVRDEEMSFPGEVEDLIDFLGFDYDEFEEAFGEY